MRVCERRSNTSADAVKGNRVCARRSGPPTFPCFSGKGAGITIGMYERSDILLTRPQSTLLRWQLADLGTPRAFLHGNRKGISILAPGRIARQEEIYGMGCNREVVKRVRCANRCWSRRHLVCRRRAGSRTSPKRTTAGPSCRILWGMRTGRKSPLYPLLPATGWRLRA